MKRIILAISTFLLGASMFTSCNQGGADANDELNDTTAIDSTPVVVPIVMESKGLTLTEVVGSPLFNDSKLILNTPKTDDKLGLGAVNFNFSIKGGNYKLGAASLDAATKGCSNSDKGQHIHVILDNHPYEASYDTSYTLKDKIYAGNHVALAFLSRSYHESLKHEGAFQLVQFKVGDDDNMDEVDLKAQHLFYSRPKGEYKADDVSQVMLDFYLVNTTISEGGNYVQATFNNKIDFKITKWAPFFVKGLPLGLNKVELKLMDASGKLIPGPYNAVVREFTLLQ